MYIKREEYGDINKGLFLFSSTEMPALGWCLSMEMVSSAKLKSPLINLCLSVTWFDVGKTAKVVPWWGHSLTLVYSLVITVTCLTVIAIRWAGSPAGRRSRPSAGTRTCRPPCTSIGIWQRAKKLSLYNRGRALVILGLLALFATGQPTFFPSSQFSLTPVEQRGKVVELMQTEILPPYSTARQSTHLCPLSNFPGSGQALAAKTFIGKYIIDLWSLIQIPDCHSPLHLMSGPNHCATFFLFRRHLEVDSVPWADDLWSLTLDSRAQRCFLHLIYFCCIFPHSKGKWKNVRNEARRSYSESKYWNFSKNIYVPPDCTCCSQPCSGSAPGNELDDRVSRQLSLFVRSSFFFSRYMPFLGGSVCEKTGDFESRLFDPFSRWKMTPKI